MPVYLIKCPDCGHQFNGLVMAHTQAPKEWVCSQCKSREAKPIFQYSNEHPLEHSHGTGCPCCGTVGK